MSSLAEEVHADCPAFGLANVPCLALGCSTRESGDGLAACTERAEALVVACRGCLRATEGRRNSSHSQVCVALPVPYELQ